MLRDPHSLIYLAVGALASFGLAFLLFGRRSSPRARGRAALVVAALLGGAFGLERRLVGSIEREGGLALVYELDVDRALATSRDRLLDDFRDAAAVSLGIHAGDGRATGQELRKLRSELRIGRAPDRADAIVAELAPDADRAVLETALRRVPKGLEAKAEPGGRRVTLSLTRARSHELEEDLARAASDTLRRRLDALGVRGAVEPRDGRVSVLLPPMEASAISEICNILEQRAELSFFMADDDEDFFADIARRPENELPRGVLFQVENAPIGTWKDGEPRGKAVHYARLARNRPESLRDARRRFEAWLATLPVDGDHALAVGKVEEVDEETSAVEPVGWRTYYLWSRVEIDGEMVREAKAVESPAGGGKGWIVTLAFSSIGSERFEAVTAANVRRRFAIVLDGVVESAPVILSRIPGGRATITMGAGSPEQQRADAKKLEVVLRSGALPAPVQRQLELAVPPKARWIAVDRALLGAAVAMVLALVAMSIRGAPRVP